ncbi:MAG: hypothetical protein ACYTFK_09465 [Planctomycetota bacterium]
MSMQSKDNIVNPDNQTRLKINHKAGTKPELKNIIIGFFIAICLVMVMGQSNWPAEKDALARYQLSTIYANGGIDHIYVLDVYTGQVWSRAVKPALDFSSVGRVPKTK